MEDDILLISEIFKEYCKDKPNIRVGAEISTNITYSNDLKLNYTHDITLTMREHLIFVKRNFSHSKNMTFGKEDIKKYLFANLDYMLKEIKNKQKDKAVLD